MRVLVLSWEYPPVIEGGLGRHVRKLSEALVVHGVAVDVLTRGPRRGADTDERLAGVAVHRVAQPPFPRDVDAFLRWVAGLTDALTGRACELVAGGDFDLIHSHDWLVADAARRAARRAGVPWLVTVHATEHGRHQGWIHEPPQSTIHASERAMIRDAHHLITCSEWMREHVSGVFGVPRRRITTLPNGIDADDLEPLVDDLPGLRARLAGGDERLVLLVGRLVHEKGFDLALEALAPIARSRPDLRFVVAGTGPADAELRRRASALGLDGRGQFLGWVGDELLHSLYRIADLCLIPSRYEPFGIVALEAMASGCPCIVTDTGGLREVVPGDETVGLRFPRDDARALGRLLTRVLDDDALRARMSSEATAHVRRFDWSRIAGATRDVYARMLAPSAAAA